MNRQIIIRLVIFTFTLLSFVPSSRAADKMVVFVSIVPQKFFVEQIGKDLVDVHVMVGPGANPATYEPRPAQMAALSKAGIYFSIGVPFEKTWLKKISSANPGMMVVPTENGIMKMPMAVHNHQEGEDHDGPGDRDHTILDPHIWLSPPLVMIQARHILTGIQHVDPAHRSYYESNYRKFINMLIDLDLDLRDIFSEKQGLQFMVFHPAWGYFADAYGLRQVPIEIEGKEPKPARLKDIIDHGREQGIKVIFAQPQFSSRSAEQIAKEIRGLVVFVDPLALNWPQNLREAARRFREALE